MFPEKLPKRVPPEREVQNQIEIEPGSKPPYRLGPAEQDELEEQIKDLLAQGFIRPSCSPYGTPVLFVPKKDGRWRVVRWVPRQYYYSFGLASDGDWAPNSQMGNWMVKRGSSRIVRYDGIGREERERLGEGFPGTVDKMEAKEGNLGCSEERV